MKRGKKYTNIKAKRDSKAYTIEEAIKEVKKLSYSKFPGSLEIHLSVNLPKDKDAKSIKGAYTLPNSAGSNVKIAVFTGKENQEIAKKAGADMVGLEDLMKEVQSGKIDFDVAIATPDVMPKIAALGKELGPKGLMPNPKTGTVTEKLEETIKEYKQGKQTFKTDAQGGIHLSVGKLDLEDEKILENFSTVIKAVEDAYGKSLALMLRKFTVSATMSPSLKVTFQA